MNQIIPRPEYPRPQMVREKWQNLNGMWSFAFDHGASGIARGMHLKDADYPLSITVPFCPESSLSGINSKDFVAAVWYRRVIELANLKSKRLILHFGAVDYQCDVWVNEQHVGSHKGGYSSFSFDITHCVKTGDENILTVRAFDDVRSGKQPAGKQSPEYHSYGCMYTRTTGIWQTVWLETVPETYIEDMKIAASWKNKMVNLDVTLCDKGLSRNSAMPDMKLEARLTDPKTKNILIEKKVAIQSGLQSLCLDADESTSKLLKPWEPGNASLYNLELCLTNTSGEVIDQVQSYCGFRDLELRPEGLYINNKPVFQRLILDQGFYPDGIYTAPDDQSLKNDIELSMRLGFNGARLHQKVFEPRFLYWADKLGYLVWGEQGSWGLDVTHAGALTNFLPEWLEIIKRDISHPSIIGWCPFNETWDQKGKRQYDDVIRQIYLVTKMADPSRPVIDTSGNYHVQTDIFDVHDYEQDIVVFAEKFKAMANGGDPYVTYPDRQKYEGQAYFVSEYGGASWNKNQQDAWGYGNQPASEAEFAQRYTSLTETLLHNPRICALCYTQLTDVEQEQNGLYTYERKHKFSDAVYQQITKTNKKLSAFEKKYS